MDEQWFQAFQVFQSVVMASVTVLLWFWGRQQKAERDLLESRFQHLTERIIEQEQECNGRIDRINENLSARLTPMVQALVGRMDRMPEDFRSKFLSLDRANDMIEESRRDRAALWAELHKRGNRGQPR